MCSPGVRRRGATEEPSTVEMITGSHKQSHPPQTSPMSPQILVIAIPPSIHENGINGNFECTADASKGKETGVSSMPEVVLKG